VGESTEAEPTGQCRLEKKQPQILRLTTPRLKKTAGAPFAQDDWPYMAITHSVNSI